MLKIAVAIFVKTPGYSPVKTRLAKSIGQCAAERFHLWSAKKVENAVRDFQKKMQLRRVDVTGFWAVAEMSNEIDFPAWRSLPRIGQGKGELGERLFRVYDLLLLTHNIVFLLGADSPDLCGDTLLNGFSALKGANFVLGPSCDGGFYLFGGSRRVPRDLWLEIPYSSSSTAESLINVFSKMQPTVKIEMLEDVDTLEDLRKIQGHEMFLVNPVDATTLSNGS